jgi:hypothetical protein
MPRRDDQTAKMATEDWRTLRVGDRIRFVAMPTGMGTHNCHQDTLDAYQTLNERRRRVRIYRLDEWNMPWIRFRIRRPDGVWAHHGLLINHDGWVRVRSRE